MLTQKTVIATIVVLLLSISTSAWATHYYVDPSGDDSDGLTWAKAFNTIQQGIDASNATIVEVNEATYYETIDFNGVSCTVTSTNPSDPNVVAATIIDANGGTNTVYLHNSETATSVLTGFTITGARHGIRCNGASPTITSCDINDTITNGILLGPSSSATISGCLSRNNGLAGIHCASNSNPLISNCDLSDNGVSGVFCNASSPTIQNCVIENNSSCGVVVGMCSPTVRYNQIGGNTYHGIWISSSSATVRSNWIYDNGQYGIRCADSNSAEFRNNTIVGSTQAGIYVASGTQPDIDNCIIWDCNDDLYNCTADYSCISDCNDANGTGNICGDGNDPNFVDPNNDNYHLAHDSPCIDKGYPSGDYTGQTDIDGEPRVQGEYVDMGADEVPRVHNVEKDKWYVTIQAAINDAADGNTIVAYPGTYQECIDFVGKAITVRSTEPNDWDVVDKTVIDANGGYRAVYFHNSEDANSVLRGFTITGATYGVHCYITSPTLSNCVCRYNSRYGMYFYLSSGVVSNSVIENDGLYGIFCYSSSATIGNNLIGASTYDGIFLQGSSASITNNWIYDNGRSGIRASASGSAVLRNNTIVGNSTAGIYHGLGTQPSISNCILWDNSDDLYNCTATYSCISDCNDAGGTGNICGDGNDPNFVDPNNDDYHVAYDSPCIDKGDPNGDYTGETDIDGEPRVQGVYVDIGADEVPRVHNIEKDKWYVTVQAAIDDACDSNTIEVHQGTYSENIDFGGKAITVRSTDPNDSNVVAATIIDGGGSGNVVEFETSETSTSVLEGLTIADGNRGIYCSSASPTISKCVITGNTGGSTDDGGGMYNYYSDPDVLNCTFTDNKADDGGGMANYYGDPLVLNCTFTDNNSTDDGAGMWNYKSSPDVNQCVFTNNTADDDGGGMFCDRNSSAPTVANCVFTGNTGDYGGGMANWNDVQATVINCVFYNNTAIYDGGAMCNEDQFGDDVSEIINCTFFDNYANDDGGAVYLEDADTNFTNCILWGNEAGDCGGEIYNNSGSYPIFNYCDIEDGLNGDKCCGPDSGGSHNDNDDPEFVDDTDPDGADDIWATSDDGLIPTEEDVVNEGDNDIVDEYDIDRDIKGDDRIIDGDVDMGAYENTSGG